MVHIVTVHWMNDKWIDIQLDHFRTYIRTEYRSYASLNEVPQRHSTKFFYHAYEPLVSHAIKLNRLAEVALSNATSDEDWLIFLDGDAFPIGDLVAYAKEKLASHPLLAVQRLENNGDIQPHPCFCITTIGFWKRIRGDWSGGFTWTNYQGDPVTDVGGNLLGILQRNNVRWHPMRRTNKKDILPVAFGIYDSILYHHGAGFRESTNRMHLLQVRRRLPGANILHILSKHFPSAQKKLNAYYGKRLPGAIVLHALFKHFSSAQKKLNKHYDRWAEKIATRQMQRISAKVYRSIQTDPFFYRQFM
jgi:hypothetical protein